VTTVRVFLSDLNGMLFSPKRFIKERFLKMSSRQIFILSFVGIFLGLLCGNIVTALLSRAIEINFVNNKESYLAAIQSLGFTEHGFLELVHVQRAYALLLIVLSPLISYIAPHLLSGALFVILWLVIRPEKTKIAFLKVMECVAISLTSVAYYMVPIFGPIIALCMVGINLSGALLVQYQMMGFLKIMSIVSALYICFFLSSGTLQILAVQCAPLFK
jgi:hypothetical protein